MPTLYIVRLSTFLGSGTVLIIADCASDFMRYIQEYMDNHSEVDTWESWSIQYETDIPHSEQRRGIIDEWGYKE